MGFIQLTFIRSFSAAVSTSSFYFSFTDADLVGGVLTVNHNLGNKYNQIAIYDHNDVYVLPAATVSVDVNTLTADFSNFQDTYGGAIPGTWNGIVTK